MRSQIKILEINFFLYFDIKIGSMVIISFFYWPDLDLQFEYRSGIKETFYIFLYLDLHFVKYLLSLLFFCLYFSRPLVFPHLRVY